jgi:cellulose synthase (UDP-forming)
LRAALLAAHVSASIAYIVWRAGWTMNAEHPVFAALVLLAEAALLACGFVFYFMILRRPERAAPPRLLTRTPTIDVLIATYNEDVELLRLTATAARDMELPHRTFICDDGRRPAMAALARELGVGYLTRPDNLDFKAGNLNHALARTDGELVLVLDADHVPHPALLSRTVGHFADEQVALVQTPQVYYNVDSFQHDLAAGRPLWHEGVLFHHVIQPGADRLNAAFFVGTGGVVRRSALAAIGNFATGSITEDIHTSMRLHAAGYRSVYVDEALGFMLAADTPFAYARQRERWCQGSMQILRSECPLWKRGLSLWQRIFYFNALSVYLTAYLHLVCYLAPGLFLLFGWSPIDAGNEHAVWWFAAHVLFSLVTYRALAGRHARLLLGECFRIINLPIFLRASLALLKPEGLRFRVTPKGRHGGLPRWLLGIVIALGLFNLTAAGAGVAAAAGGQAAVGPVLFATMFATFFALAAALATAHVLARRRAEDAFMFPVSLPARVSDAAGAQPALIRRLNEQTAIVICERSVAEGAQVQLDLRAAQIAQPVCGLVSGVDHDGAAPVLRVELETLGREDRQRLSAVLFHVALPTFFEGLTGTPPVPARPTAAALPVAAHDDREVLLPVHQGIL